MDTTTQNELQTRLTAALRKLQSVTHCRAASPRRTYELLKVQLGRSRRRIQRLHAAADLTMAAEYLDGATGITPPPPEGDWSGWADWCARRCVLYLQSAEQHLGLAPLPPDYYGQLVETLAARPRAISHGIKAELQFERGVWSSAALANAEVAA